MRIAAEQMDELHKLIEKKKYEGFLSERDALVFWPLKGQPGKFGSIAAGNQN